LESVESQNIGDFDTLISLTRTHAVRKALNQNACRVFYRSLGTAGQLDVIQDAAINQREESASFAARFLKEVDDD
jgi:hypothetical protein